MLGDTLIQAARRESFGWSWRTADETQEHDLLGYSHGTAGVAHALFELAKLPAGSAYLNAARQAVAYERHHFDHRTGHWPDFRADCAAGEPMCAWCNGAAGISLSRCRDPLPRKRPEDLLELQHAASAIRRNIQGSIQAGIPDASYCHGLAGSLEALGEITRIEGCRNDRSLVAQAARAMAGTFHARSQLARWTAGPADAGPDAGECRCRLFLSTARAARRTFDAGHRSCPVR